MDWVCRGAVSAPRRQNNIPIPSRPDPDRAIRRVAKEAFHYVSRITFDCGSAREARCSLLYLYLFTNRTHVQIRPTIARDVQLSRARIVMRDKQLRT
jgi:hypothetical protein